MKLEAIPDKAMDFVIVISNLIHRSDGTSRPRGSAASLPAHAISGVDTCPGAAARMFVFPDSPPHSVSIALRPTFRALLLALAVIPPWFAASGVFAQANDPAPIIAPDLSEEVLRTHAQGLKEVREAIARKDYAAAVTRLEALLKLRPREAQGRFLLGTAQAAMGNTDAAIATYRALTEDYPELPEPYNNLAVLYADRGDYNGARIALETAVATAPDWSTAHENLGDLYVRIATVEYEKTGKLDRGNKTAPVKLALARQLLQTRNPSSVKK